MKRVKVVAGSKNKSVKKVIIFFDNEELYKSYKRALEVIADMQIAKYSDKSNDKSDTVLYTLNEPDSWWEFRTNKKALNPLIIFGFEDEDTFVKRNPAIKAYNKEHAYIQIPFDLNSLIKVIKKLNPLYDHATRKMMVNNYLNRYEHKLITHDLKIIGNDKKVTISNFKKVVNFYKSKGMKEIASEINSGIKNIEQNKNWQHIALSMKECLENRLKKGGT